MARAKTKAASVAGQGSGFVGRLATLGLCAGLTLGCGGGQDGTPAPEGTQAAAAEAKTEAAARPAETGGAEAAKAPGTQASAEPVVKAETPVPTKPAVVTEAEAKIIAHLESLDTPGEPGWASAGLATPGAVSKPMTPADALATWKARRRIL